MGEGTRSLAGSPFAALIKPQGRTCEEGSAEFRDGFSKAAMEEPGSGAEATKEPKVAAGTGFDAIVVPANSRPAPPAGFDPFGAPVTNNLLLFAAIFKTQWWTVGGDGEDLQGDRLSEQMKGRIEPCRTRREGLGGRLRLFGDRRGSGGMAGQR